jgi:hypothetical protein
MKPALAALSFAISLAYCAASAHPLSPTAPAQVRQPAELQGTQRDNQVELMFGSDVTSLDFRFHDGKATAKGAMHGVIKDLQDDRLVLHVYSERKGSEEMANEWFDRLGRDDHRMVGADVISGNTTRPEKLNFWVSGDLWINGEQVEDLFYIGQGHRMFTNNWWIGNVHGGANRCCSELRLPRKDDTTFDTAYCLRATSNNRFVVGLCRSLRAQDEL